MAVLTNLKKSTLGVIRKVNLEVAEIVQALVIIRYDKQSLSANDW